ncbi:SRPBCC domain-containing protein [Nocardiopsis sp. N85]|uniref:SRPBCC family protein n=1 Tax=Nocardiopsis sp. N85 TaxID=3029400 RepID=UPI00237EFCB3|nr:SRPBCC domain-containing protein [Nocardiopsis sp. N85]MDE3723225.1 SRPBCC domain-containing protein [Nocardiopsis sp. N85]
MEAIERAVPMPAPPERLWRAMSTPAAVGDWLGGLGPDGVPHGSDGTHGTWILTTPSVEYVRLRVREVGPGRSITLDWSEFGVEAPSRIRVAVETGPAGSLLRIREEFPHARSVPRVAREVFWDDCVERLRFYLAAEEGGQAPPGIRSISLGVRVPVGTWLPLHRRNLFRWLPVSGPGYPPTAFYVVDDAGPWRFPIRRVEDYFDERLSLFVDVGDGVTRAVVRTHHDGTGVVLSIHHSQWPIVSGAESRMTRLRDVFEITWRASLEQAVRAAGSEGGRHGR